MAEFIVTTLLPLIIIAIVGLAIIGLIVVIGGAILDAIMPVIVTVIIAGCIGFVVFTIIGAFLEHFDLLKRLDMFGRLQPASMWHVALGGVFLGAVTGIVIGIVLIYIDRPMRRIDP